VHEERDFTAFYDRAYSREGDEAGRSGRWRALGAIGKADHVVALCARVGLRPATVLEVGCGDGAVLAQLHARGFGTSHSGVEITERAVQIAARRPELASVRLYDGRHLPDGDSEYDLGVLSHVLEHVPDPRALLAETARVCRAVIVEVPLEDNLSARRASKTAQADEIGHLQRLSRRSTRAIVARAGLRIEAELDDPLPRTIHTFFAGDRRTAAASTLKWLARSAIHRAAPSVARRLFTVHYACLCVPDRSGSVPR
jgi:SAM-dependent methyltransferase